MSTRLLSITSYIRKPPSLGLFRFNLFNLFVFPSVVFLLLNYSICTSGSWILKYFIDLLTTALYDIYLIVKGYFF